MRQILLPLIALAFFTGSREHALADEPAPAVIEMGTRGVANFIARLEKEHKATVAFFGGSITQNKTGHSKRVADWLREEWPQVEFTFMNAGLSSTCSTTGAFRAERDVFSKGQIDLLVLEFAVNDDQDARHDRETSIRGLEGIIRQYFEANPTGDVISVQFVNPEILALAQAGQEAISVAAHKAVARHYDVPSVDVGLALAREIKAGKMTWEKDYKDTHPNPAGYQFASDLITKVIAETISGETPQPRTLPAPLDPFSYSGATIVDPQAFSWLGGWKYGRVSAQLLPTGAIREDFTAFNALRSDEAGNYLYHTFSGTMLGAFVLAGPDAGILEVSLDGAAWQKVDLYHAYSKGLNYPRSVILAEKLTKSYHTAAIRVAAEKNPQSLGNTATILYFEVNE